MCVSALLEPTINQPATHSRYAPRFERVVQEPHGFFVEDPAYAGTPLQVAFALDMREHSGDELGREGRHRGTDECMYNSTRL